MIKAKIILTAICLISITHTAISQKIICTAITDRINIFGLNIKRDDGSARYYKGDLVILDHYLPYPGLTMDLIEEKWNFKKSVNNSLLPIPELERLDILDYFREKKLIGGSIYFTPSFDNYLHHGPYTRVAFTRPIDLLDGTYCLELSYMGSTFLLRYRSAVDSDDFVLLEWIQTTIE